MYEEELVPLYGHLCDTSFITSPIRGTLKMFLLLIHVWRICLDLRVCFPPQKVCCDLKQ